MNDQSPLYDRAVRVLPGGVTAGARRNVALGYPLYIAHAEGPFVVDEQGRRLIDTCMSNGATLLGHGHPAVVDAIRRAAEMGMACAYDGEAQVRLAERLVASIPAFEQVRFTTSGTEATMYAVRIARAYTGRTKVLKFVGHFHGYNDPLAFNFWPPPDIDGGEGLPSPRPETTGLPPEASHEIVVATFNDTAAFRAALDTYGHDLAAIILEPINYDDGAILPDRSFLDTVRAETTKRGIVLVFDEILSGYRTGPDCAQGYLGVTPDLCTLGKAIGGGVPLSVFGGKRDLMALVSPVGNAVHTGTYNAHLLPIMAAHAFLDTIAEPGFYARLLALSERLYRGLQAAFDAAGLPVRVQGIGARFGIYFGLDPHIEVVSYQQASRLDTAMQRAFCRAMDKQGVYVNPAWHHGLCAMYTDAIVDDVVTIAGEAAVDVVKAGQG